MKSGIRVLFIVLSALLCSLALGEKPLIESIEYVPFVESVSVDEKVERIVAECREAGIRGEYATAVWLHDWLTHNANYDYTFTHYEASGVLLEGTGVCESYMRAYKLLLNRVGIQNNIVRSEEMDHTWNLVCLDGVWCHVDVTWDDPNEGGFENHDYFGMSDDMIRRDHTWPASVPKCESAQNYYPIRSGGSVPVADGNDVIRQLNALAAERTEAVSLCYVGDSGTFYMYDMADLWYRNYAWEYGVQDMSGDFYQYSARFTLIYDESGDGPADLDREIEENWPSESLAEIKNISLASNGTVFLYDFLYEENVFYGQVFLDEWEEKASAYKKLNLRVVCVLEDTSAARANGLFGDKYPSVTFVSDDGGNALFNLLSCAGYGSSEVSIPVMFLISSEGRIIDYTAGGLYGSAVIAKRLADRRGYDMTLPKATEAIEEDAFQGAAFESADLSGARLTSIGSGAFRGLASLTRAKIPSGVTAIADNAFAGCGNLVILCEYGSAAHDYAERKGIDYLTY